MSGKLLLGLMGAVASAAPTFNKDIAPILYENCATCHRPGEVAPFSLLTYQDAAKRAGLIATVTKKRYMPPWKPEPGYGNFDHTRRLTDEQIARIGEWAEAGAPER
jgi:mono/diheme cytochrome c family protein